MRGLGLSVGALLLAACGGGLGAVDEAPSVSVAAKQPGRAGRAELRAAAPPADAPRYRVPLGGADVPRRGAANPTVVMVIFDDFECPFCQRLAPTVERLLREYPNDLQLVFRHNPLPMHRNAHLASQAAIEAFAQGGGTTFWRFHDLLFETRAMERDDLLAHGRALGMDVDALRRALDDGTHRGRVEEDIALARRVGASGTPFSFLNGRDVRGAQPHERFVEVIEQEIALAGLERLDRVPRNGMYARRIDGAQDRIPARAPSPPSRGEPDPDAVYRVPIDGRPQRGRADALVTIVEFSEFQCPFCSRVQPTLERLQQRYGRDLRIVFRHNPLPFHDMALPAAKVAAEVHRRRGDQAFFRFHDELFARQRDLSEAMIVQVATEVGLSRADATRAMNGDSATVREDMALAQQLGARGTPYFFINGRTVRGAQPQPVFETAIERALAEARARVQRGVSRRRVYAALTDGGATEPQYVAGAPSPPRAPQPTRVSLSPPADAPSRGPASAPVTIVEIEDFQCPFCQRVQSTIAQLRQRYPNRVRFVWMDYPLPFHQDAFPAAMAARSVRAQAGDDAFWAYHDLLFANQRALDQDNLVRLAGQIRGVDANRVRSDLQSGRYRAAVQADMDAIQNTGARFGTPSFVINGQILQGAQPVEAFARAIEDALRAGP